MPGLDSDSQRLLLLIGLAVAMLGLLALLYLRRRRSERSPMRRLRRVTDGLLSNFIIPDSDGGEIHIEHAALTPRGILVLDVKDVTGHVFGSDAMQDWTVLADRRRFTFSNPQQFLYDRMAAVQRLVPNVTVRGFVVFSSGAEFSKGLPSNVILFDDLVKQEDAARDPKMRTAENYRVAWDQLRHEAVSAQVDHLIREA